MEVQFGPNPVDEQNLIYKYQRKIKVFNTDDSLPNRGYNLVASSSKYGLVFVASPDGSFSAYSLSQLIDKTSEAPHLTVKLQEKPSHIAVSCDHELLAVTGGQLLCIYKVTDFQKQNVSPSLSLRCDVNPATFVSAMQWNPCIPDSIVIVFYDGTLLACQASTSQVKKVQSKGRCLCWSPKGKQFVTGNSDGTLTQFKPDLTAAKSVPAPKLFEGAPVEALAIYWISTYQFAVVYKNATDNSRPAVTIVNTPKGGQPLCLNYEDVCYSMGSNRPWYYYLLGLAPWNLILSSSSNSMEIATIASADGANWVQWSLSDEARAELPLTDKKQENYPVGIWIDTAAIHQLPWGENDTLPHMPLLIVVSQSGLLALLNIINLNKQASQLCTPPQQLTLPAAALTTDIPGVVQAPAQPAPQPVIPQAVAPPAPKPQPAPQYQPPPQAVQAPPSAAAQSATMFGAPGLGSFQQPAISQAFSAASLPQPTEPKQPVEVKPAPPTQPSAPAVQKPPPQPTPAETAQAQEAYAAAKAEQERLKAIKANQELKNMLVKEVNDFQMELYKFMVKTRDTQAKLQQDIDAINLNFPLQGMDAEQLRKECSLDELRGAIVQLKLELVRACAVVAEARTHAEAKDSHQWTQADPLTIKRVASIKKLAYYVQNQVDQAYKALDYKWNQMALKDPKNFKPGQRMIRPVLDDVYQPLVKQQEILCRQEAVLRTLKNTLKEVDSGPMFKSTSLLRSTPFKNKDPLSKLTKNILNMSIEPQTKPKEPLLSAQKLDALRDMLANHKTIKVKPVNVELRQQLAAMRLSYEKSMKEKAQMKEKQEFLKAQAQLKEQQEVMMAQAQLKQQELLRAEAQFKLQQQMKEEMMKQYVPPKQYAPPDIVKIEPKLEVVEQYPITVPSFTPVANNAKQSAPVMNNVVRTLFTNKPEPAQPVEAPKPLPTQGLFASKPPGFATPSPQPQSPSANTRSVLKDLLQNKQANAATKSEANTFMGQKICSPVAFSFGSSTVTTDAPTSEPPSYFTTKPPARVLDTKSIFSQAQAKLSQTNVNVKSSETGEEEGTANKTIELKKEDKPITNMFGSKSSLLSNLNKPTEQKPQESPKTENKAPIKVLLKAAEKAKENIPEKVAESVLQEPQKIEKKEPEVKPLGQQGFNLGSTPVVTPTVTSTSEPQKPAETKTESKPDTPKVEEKAVSSTPTAVSPTPTAVSPTPTAVSPSASSLFASANASSPTTIKPQPLFGSVSPTATPTETVTTPPSSTATSTDTAEKPSVFASAAASSASSLFSTAVASQASKTTQSGSIFSTSKPSGVFASSPGSIFGSAATTTTSSVFGTSTAASVFSSEAKPSVFSTPTPATAAFGATSTTQSVFASTPSVFAQATSTPSSVFASAAPGSIFGTATTQASVFGTSTTTTSAFGSTTTQASVFGTPATTAQSLFGSAATSQPSVFGSPATTTQSVFGTATATTQASVFGGGASQSVFGSTPPSTQSSIFGSPSGQASVFGSAPATQAGVFGAVPATTAQSGGSLFGGAESNLFAAASISTTSAPSQSTGGSIFGGSSPGSVFGGGATNVFGGKASFSQSNPTAASIFGGGAAFGQKQPQANNFWTGGANNTTSTGFGSGFGQQASTQASSIFGGSTGGSFSTPSPAGQAFGSPQQAPAFGAAENKPSVFGSPQQQSAPAFGGSPVFGSNPVFGQSSGFGSPTSGGFGSFGGFNKSPSSGFGAPAAFGGGATFGGAPAFGSTSPGKVFGGSPGPAFGSPTQSNATFESLATQNTLTFGNLAQQSGQQPAPAAPSFNTSPAFTGWRG